MSARKFYIKDYVLVERPGYPHGFPCQVVGYRRVGDIYAYIVTCTYSYTDEANLLTRKKLAFLEERGYNVTMDFLGSQYQTDYFDEDIKPDPLLGQQKKASGTESPGLFCIECQEFFPEVSQVFKDGRCLCSQCKKLYSWKYSL